MIMKPYKLSICCAILLALVSCGSEDNPEAVIDTMTDCFAPDPEATDAVSVMRRSFKQEEGSYLLFTDTLTHEYLGKDYNGDDCYKTELLDMSYTIGNTAAQQQIVYQYTYLETQAAKEAAVEFLKDYVLPHLPSSLRPFSWFLAYSIYDATNYDYVTALTGQRCIAISAGDLDYVDKDELARTVLIKALGSGMESQEEALEAFYAYGEGLYGEYFDNPDNLYYDSELNMIWLNNYGFIAQPTVWGFALQGKYPDKTLDLSSYTELVLTYTDEEIAEMYGSYPTVIEKAGILRGIIGQLGYIF